MLICFFIGCRQQNNDSLVIYVGGDTAGWITPCGCAANQSGGLARRATLIQNAGQQHATLLLDAGGSAVGTGPYQRIKLTALLNGLHSMGLAAHNIGAPEAEFLPETLLEIASKTNTTWLSSNLKTFNGKAFGIPVLRTTKAGLKIAVAGIIDPELVTNDNWVAVEPINAVLTAFGNEPDDVRIVLAYYDESGLRELAQRLPEVDYIIGGPTGQSVSPLLVSQSTILSATNKGKFLARIELSKRPDKLINRAARITEVSSDLSEAAPQLENLKQYYSRLAAKDFTAAQADIVKPLLVQSNGYSIAGSDACKSCHPQDQTIWDASKHAAAWQVLEMKHAHYDPSCQRCHTTGYAQLGGFQNVARSANRIGVGCENCHGPSQAHVDNPKVRTPFQASQQCVGCHDHENSPTFNFETYWAKIVHGAKQ